MIIKYILKYFTSSVLGYVVTGVVASIFGALVYYGIESYFSAHIAVKAAVNTQKKQEKLRGYDKQVIKEYNSYRKALVSKGIDCKLDVCTVSELKHALHN